MNYLGVRGMGSFWDSLTSTANDVTKVVNQVTDVYGRVSSTFNPSSPTALPQPGAVLVQQLPGASVTPSAQPSGLSTGEKIGIGVAAVALLGTIGYLAFKK